jgi:hypothetical protein
MQTETLRYTPLAKPMSLTLPAMMTYFSSLSLSHTHTPSIPVCKIHQSAVAECTVKTLQAYYLLLCFSLFSEYMNWTIRLMGHSVHRRHIAHVTPPPTHPPGVCSSSCVDTHTIRANHSISL